MRACTHEGLGTPTASQRNIFDWEKTHNLFSCAPVGIRTSVLWILSPTLCQSSHPVTLINQSPSISWPFNLFSQAAGRTVIPADTDRSCVPGGTDRQMGETLTGVVCLAGQTDRRGRHGQELCAWRDRQTDGGDTDRSCVPGGTDRHMGETRTGVVCLAGQTDGGDTGCLHSAQSVNRESKQDETLVRRMSQGTWFWTCGGSLEDSFCLFVSLLNV